MTPSIEAKIKSPDELARLLGVMKKGTRVALCHGTFDLVHPGHLRHLAYVRARCDVLVVSVTSDRHVAKPGLRPYVPERLRAVNLAALEMVDHVVVDDHPTPIELIRALRPDVFAKGADYHSGDDPRTREERATVEECGGEVLFTPGDVVYSSSAILASDPPDLGLERLRTLMDAEGVTFDALRAALYAARGRRVHVVGDLIVDRIVRARSLGSSAKTPTLSVLVEGSEDYVGGAGVVALHLAAAGARVRLTTVAGDDEVGCWAGSELSRAVEDLTTFVDPSRPTTLKQTVAAAGHRLLKMDVCDSRPINEFLRSRVRDAVASSSGAVVFSDFRHGVFTRETAREFAAAVPAGVYRAADSQVASRWGNVLDFAGFDLLAANEREARWALGDQETSLRPLGTELHSRARCGVLLLKLGARGVLAFRGDGGEPRSFFAVDSLARAAPDPVGAGDAMLAYAVLAAEAGPAVAAILGSVAAAVECEAEGNVPVRAERVLERIDDLERRMG